MSVVERAIVVLLLAASVTAQTQDLSVKAIQKGSQNFEIDIRSGSATVADCLAAIASACGLEVQVAKPENAAILSREKVDVELTGTSLESLVELLAMAIGLDGEVELDRRLIVIAESPAEGDDAAALEHCRSDAITALIAAYGGSEDAQDEVELLLRSARLELAGGEYSQAFDTYQDFLSNFKKHPAVPEATVAAAHAAFEADRHEDLQRIVQEFLGSYPDHPLVGRCQLIAARSRLRTGDLGGGMGLLKGLIRQARERVLPQRDGMLAELLLAETLHERGEDEAAIAGLAEAEIRYDRKLDQDLIRQIRFYMAICRRATGNLRDALHDLEVAAFEVPNDALRVRTLLLYADLLLESGNPLVALTSTRSALTLNPQGETLFRARRLAARAYRRMQLEDEASKEMLALVLDAPKLLPDPELRRRELSQSLREIGEIYLDKGLVHDAVASFKAVINAAEHHADELDPARRELVAECRYLIAVAQARAGRHREAVETLDSITEGISSESLAHEIRRLKGDCYFESGLPEAAMRVWKEGEGR
ncbi:MAG: tetratricopeptide repeat protein [Planctomycetes bacterium]|nr:tetratricopeptide repeat protein [Planctomycetota bacterium]